jgi:exodeoxyribonuclease VII large subunit
VVVEELDVRYTLGEAARRREEIVRRLEAEGLADRNRGLHFPELPLRVGLVTSLGSDAHNDVLRTFQESGFAFRVAVHGARVQGRLTEPSVLNALDWFRARTGEFDVVLVCRGGGSRTDLAWFDSEPLGRAVADFPLPVVVGIGHEQDHSVLDAVGWRCKTPTAAAAYLVERVRDSMSRLEQSGRDVLELAARRLRDEAAAGAQRAQRLALAARALLGRHAAELTHRRMRVARGTRHVLQSAGRELARRAREIPRGALVRVGQHAALLGRAARQVVQGARRDLAEAGRRVRRVGVALGPAGLRRLVLERERLDARGRRLGLVDPVKVVERGYAIVRREDGAVLSDPADAPPGARLEAQLRGGRLGLRSEGPAPNRG